MQPNDYYATYEVYGKVEGKWERVPIYQLSRREFDPSSRRIVRVPGRTWYFVQLQYPDAMG